MTFYVILVFVEWIINGRYSLVEEKPGQAFRRGGRLHDMLQCHSQFKLLTTKNAV